MAGRRRRVSRSSGEILTGTTYLPADGLKTMLTEVAEAYATRRDMLDDRATAGRLRSPRAAAHAARRCRARLVGAGVDRQPGGRPSAIRTTAASAPTASSCTSRRCSAALAEYAQTRDAALARRADAHAGRHGRRRDSRRDRRRLLPLRRRPRLDTPAHREDAGRPDRRGRPVSRRCAHPRAAALARRVTLGDRLRAADTRR